MRNNLVIILIILTSFSSYSKKKSAASVIEKIPSGEKIALIAFKDCAMEDNNDCAGSGERITNALERELISDGTYTVHKILINNEVLKNRDIELFCKKASGFKYILTGEVNNYREVGPMQFRTDELDITFRIYKTSSYQQIAYFSMEKGSGSGFGEATKVLDKMVKKLIKNIKE